MKDIERVRDREKKEDDRLYPGCVCEVSTDEPLSSSQVDERSQTSTLR